MVDSYSSFNSSAICWRIEMSIYLFSVLFSANFFFCLRRIIASTSILLAVNNSKRTLNETFLGLLYPTENYRVYGYLTNTKVKFIMVTTDLNAKDADARNFFRKFHAAYVDAVSNPFHVPGKKVASRSFGARVSTIVKSFGSGTTS
eukprot:XP_020404126.1 trafficking protein particle complex subunit 2-like protein isoform X1 [Zea mays]